MLNSKCRSNSVPLRLLVATAVAAVLIDASGALAQSAEVGATQQASLPSGNDAHASSLPLERDEVREIQNQLIALGFDPGPADGQAGPATLAAAQHYDQDRGGNGRVSIDAELLERLKQDKGPRLTYDQVQARSQARYKARVPTGVPPTAAPAAGANAANQFGSVMQQIAPIVGAVIANSNNNRGYGPGYYGPGPGYYGPGPGYYGPSYGYGY